MIKFKFGYISFCIFVIIIIIYMYNIYPKNNEIEEYDYIIATGASENHEILLLNMIYTFYLHNNNFMMIVYNLGISENTIYLLNRFSLNHPLFFIHNFQFSKYPSYFNISNNSGEYAWKPVIISEVYNKYKHPLIWLDAGCNITGNIHYIIDNIKEKSVWSQKTSHDVKKYTHPSMIKYFNFPSKWLNKTCCAGGTVAFMYPSKIAQNILYKWGKCARKHDCIAPPGSDRSNHRQDQSSLTIISFLNGKLDLCDNNIAYNFSIHYDYNSKYKSTNRTDIEKLFK